MIKENKRIIFNGNDYSDEWQKEAGKRGLLNLRNTVDALPKLVKPEVVEAFEKYKVLNERELHARYEVALETYNKTINIEAQLMVLMANRYILPAALDYQSEVAHERGGGQGGRRLGQGGQEAARQGRQADRRAARADVDKLAGAARARRRRRPGEAREVLARQGHPGDGRRCARPATPRVLVPHDLWPLPTYREMLFIK